jgi:hypothetical protein
MTSAENRSLKAREIPDNPPPRASKRIRAILADAYSFIRSAEANQAVAAVTQEELISDQIKRNGESSKSKEAKYDPYSHDPEKAKPSGEEPPPRANFASGTDTGLPTKLDRLLALKNELEGAIDEVKKLSPTEVASAEELTDGVVKASTTGEVV